MMVVGGMLQEGLGQLDLWKRCKEDKDDGWVQEPWQGGFGEGERSMGRKWNIDHCFGWSSPYFISINPDLEFSLKLYQAAHLTKDKLSSQASLHRPTTKVVKILVFRKPWFQVFVFGYTSVLTMKLELFNKSFTNMVVWTSEEIIKKDFP